MWHGDTCSNMYVLVCRYIFRLARSSLSLKVIGLSQNDPVHEWFAPTRHIFGHFGDGGVTAASARIIATASAEASFPAQPHHQPHHSVCGVE